MEKHELHLDLSRGIRPLYLLLGPEAYLRNAAAKQIAELALHDCAMREMNEYVCDLVNDELGPALAAAGQRPMLSKWRTVTVYGLGKMSVADEEVLTEYLAKPAKTTALILVADDLDKRKKVSKLLLESCAVVDFSELQDGEAKAWARSYVQGLNANVPDQVLSEVINLVGTDISSLRNELDKLIAYAGSGVVTMQMVNELTIHFRELSNFELADHLMTGDRRKALATLYRILESGAEPIMLLGLIASNYHRLALGKSLFATGGRQEVFKGVPMPAFKRDFFLSTLQRNSSERIARALQLTATADLAIKTSQATPRLQIEMLVIELTR